MKASDSDRDFRGNRRTTSKAAFAAAALRYKPVTIHLLFVAEAPPAFRFNRLFYFEDLSNGDTLFLETVKTLYGDVVVGFIDGRFSPGHFVERIRILSRHDPPLLDS